MLAWPAAHHLNPGNPNPTSQARPTDYRFPRPSGAASISPKSSARRAPLSSGRHGWAASSLPLVLMAAAFHSLTLAAAATPSSTVSASSVRRLRPVRIWYGDLETNYLCSF
ncbi:hypothetical protein PVAP13_8NG149103 [Panicum virgatum]|uniref:Uncharacterized protein n=1 Tax=Panicum virgatum TaxID=38727 RepID=A0A8T0PGB5_PANVG|nr:hypothetical protein PVAP13_8NG149103 [Panicum virgatum]